ncbi:MAG: DNA-3-methyladenine glycosylase [Verrucomicrobiales bacterium]
MCTPGSDLAEHSTVVAPALLGSILHGPNGSGRIVEVEAYAGAEDPASHAARGLTRRTEPMFGPAGVLYVYLIYGMYHCANVVTGPEGDGQAVLIRALEPTGDPTLMRAARPKAKRDIDLTNGPGKLCQALGIDRSHDRLDLLDPQSVVQLTLIEPDRSLGVVQSTRIGLSAAKETPWRWHIRDNPWASKG